jgi:predicted RNA polymerase sigma factor
VDSSSRRQFGSIAKISDSRFSLATKTNASQTTIAIDIPTMVSAWITSPSGYLRLASLRG